MTRDDLVKARETLAAGYHPDVTLREWMGRDPTPEEVEALARAATGSRFDWLGILSDLGLLAGSAALCYGAHQAFPPAAWIVGGALLLTAAYRLGMR